MIRRLLKSREEVQEVEPTGFDSFDLRLGDLMRGERATLGKSLLDVQRELRIRASYIAAIENCDMTAFDTPGFVAGYVRSYARYLGMDPDKAFAAFCAESGFEPVHGLSPEARRKPEVKAAPVGDPLANPNASFVPPTETIFDQIEPGAIGSFAVLIALVGVLGYGGWSVLREIQRVDFAPVEQPLGVTDTLEGLGNAGSLAEAAGAGTEMRAPAATEMADRIYRPRTLDVPVLVARDGPISTLDPNEVGALAEVANSVAPAVPAVGPNAIDAAVAEAVGVPADGVQVFGPQAPEVAIFAVRPSWVRVQAADGSVLFEKILDACERYVLPSLETAPVLRTGNAGSVYFAVNGKAFGPAGKGASVAKNVSLGSDAIAEAYPEADPEADADLARFVAAAGNAGLNYVPAAICGP
ncbi:MAG: helix-turn-helix domain-containing protein [Rhodobacterales bacterium]|nr:MAG: helix-turn-helix domain-containing protein [Rhodobacterales bacterium]